MKKSNLVEFKKNMDAISYEDILAARFKDLKYHKHGEDFGTPTLYCTFTMDMASWKQYQKSGQLGGIYNCDLSNYLGRLGVLNEYAVPIVSDKDRAKNGRKTIRVEFRLKGHPYRAV